MSEPFIGEIKLVPYGFAPRGWAACNGQLLPINQNQALFSILGTTYGGNGSTNFALPNLVARAPVGAGQGPGLSSYTLGQASGQASVTLGSAELPPHTHDLKATAATTGRTGTPESRVQLGTASSAAYREATNLAPMAADALATVGGSSHENRQPYLGLQYVIALVGIYPSQA